MKTLVYVCDWMGILGSACGVIVGVVEKNTEVALWAFAAGVWATASLVKDYYYLNEKV